VRRLLPLLLLVLGVALGAVETVDRTAVADSLAILAAQLLPVDRPVFLEIAADEWTPLLTDRLKTRLLSDNVRLLTRDAADGVSLEIGCVAEPLPHKGLLDLSRTLIRYRFTLQVTDNTTGQVLAWKTRDHLEPESGTNSEHLRWYDPVLVSAVIGGLVYLFYFGAK
jgi:hypothetical protein